jgi:hypothetical protein
MRAIETYHAHQSVKYNHDFDLTLDYLIYKNSAEKYLHMY